MGRPKTIGGGGVKPYYEENGITIYHGDEAENNFQASILVMKEINKILWWEEMRKLMPLVAKALKRKGVKFPK